MSRGPGRVQREVAILIAANADGAWTTADLCQDIYGVKTAEKKHRVAVIRALERMELPPLWKVWRIGRPGCELGLYNAGSVMSTVRKGCINKGENASDPAVLKEWTERDGIKRATKDVREAVRYHKASPVGKIEIRLNAARAFVDRALVAELEAELQAAKTDGPPSREARSPERRAQARPGAVYAASVIQASLPSQPSHRRSR
jgi:hypothetical protein